MSPTARAAKPNATTEPVAAFGLKLDEQRITGPILSEPTEFT